MKAITIPEFGDADQLTYADVEAPTPGPGEVLLDVVAAGVNRADVTQRQGNYPPPPGITEIPGLECSGRIAAFGEGVTSRNSGWDLGDEVVALLSGGGYAEQVNVPVGQLLPRPAGLSMVEAAGLIETTATVWSNVFMEARLAEGETVLFHGGSSGIGTTGIQIAKARGATVAVTAGSQAKLDACRELGADVAINYKDTDFVEAIKDATDGRGADVILDIIGAAYLERNVRALAVHGRLMVIGLQGGAKGEVSLNRLLMKRASIHAASLRVRPPEGAGGKAEIVADVREHVWPLVAEGKLKPLVHETFPLEKAADAHRVMEESSHIGKVVLTVRD